MNPNARRLRRALALLALGGLLPLAGCSSGSKGGPKLTRADEARIREARQQAQTGPTWPPSAGAPMVGTESLIATATGQSVPVFSEQGAKTPVSQLSNPNEDGAPRVFLIKARRGDWLQVLLPVRPNGSKGWIRVSDVAISSTVYRIRVELSAHRITVVRGRDLIAQEPVGVGKANTPTPGGEYFIAELVQPPNPNGAYGPYAYGLSGFSDVLKEFQGGNGLVGIHGTNEPGLLGQDVSFGCIRMSNAGITKLASVLPLGTPVYITG